MQSASGRPGCFQSQGGRWRGPGRRLGVALTALRRLTQRLQQLLQGLHLPGGQLPELFHVVDQLFGLLAADELLVDQRLDVAAGRIVPSKTVSIDIDEDTLADLDRLAARGRR